MKSKQAIPSTIDEYIAGFPKDVQVHLKKIRSAVRKPAPGAKESIKYHIPTFSLHGNLVHFAAYEKYIGIYPAPREEKNFKNELAGYEGAKSSVSFPLDKPMPLDLISRIVKYRLALDIAAAKAKAKGI